MTKATKMTKRLVADLSRSERKKNIWVILNLNLVSFNCTLTAEHFNQKGQEILLAVLIIVAHLHWSGEKQILGRFDKRPFLFKKNS